MCPSEDFVGYKITKIRLFKICAIFLVSTLHVSLSAKAEYQVPADDPMFTHKVEKKKPMYHQVVDQEKGTYEEVLADVYVDEQKRLGQEVHPRLLDAAAQNKWHGHFGGKLWYDAIGLGIKSGFLGDKKIEEAMCKTIRRSWGLEKDAGVVELTGGYDEYLSRVQAHAKSMGAVLHQNPEVKRGMIVYRFQEVKSQTIDNDFSYMLDPEHRKKIKEKRKKQVQEHFEKTGLGFSGWVKTFGRYKTTYDESEEPTIVETRYDVSKNGFINFYSHKNLHTPPDYLYEDHKISIEQRIKYPRARSPAENLRRKNLSAEELEEENSAPRKSKLEFIEAKPEATFSTVYALPSNVKNNPNKKFWLIHYTSRFENEGNGVIDVGKQKARVSCEMTGQDISNLGSLKPKMPFFDMYSLDEKRSCKPYFNWYKCYVLSNWGAECDKVPKEQPEMCNK